MDRPSIQIPPAAEAPSGVGKVARQVTRVEEMDAISDDMMANIPVVGDLGEDATTTFHEVDDDVIFVAPSAVPRAQPSDSGDEEGAAPSRVSALAQQLRYEMGEAFARELDRAEASFTGALGDLETRLAEATAALVEAQAAVERERAARTDAEARLRMFKDLALK